MSDTPRYVCAAVYRLCTAMRDTSPYYPTVSDLRFLLRQSYTQRAALNAAIDAAQDALSRVDPEYAQRIAEDENSK